MSNAAAEPAASGALRLRQAGPVGVRTPAFPALVLRDVLAAADGRQALHTAFNREPDRTAVIAIASTSLGAAARRWLADSFDADDGVAISLYAYLARSSLRATPFAACAAVGLADVSESGVALTCSPLRLRARPDAEWLYNAGEALEADSAAFERLELRPSGLVHAIGGRLEVADVARAQVRAVGAVRSLVPIPTAFNATVAVSTLLAACAPGMTAGDLAQCVAENVGASRREVLALIAKLTAIGVFVTEARPALGGWPGAALARVYHKCAPARAAAFDRFRSILASVDDAALRDVPAILAAGRETAHELAEAPHVAQIDALRTYDGSLPLSLLNRLGTVIEKLAELSPPTREPQLLAAGFRAKYNAGRYVPLLQLLDPAEGLAFETLLAAPDAARDRIDAALAQLAMHAVADRQVEVALEGHRYATLLAARGERGADFRPPSHFEAIATLRSGAGGALDIALTGHVYEGRATSLGRFGDVLSLPLPAPTPEHSIVAEFVGTPYLRRVANVANQSTRTPYEFVCGASSSRDSQHTITPADVVVGCEGTRLVMRLKDSGRQLRVLFSHRLNAGFASRLAVFVQYLSLTDLALVGIPWGRISATLPYRPRLTLDGVIVAAAQWRIPAHIAADFGGAAAQTWRERWMLPATFEIAEADNRLPVDVRSGIACAYVRKVAQRAAVIEATEMIPAFDDAIVAGPGGRYVAEIAVTYEVGSGAVDANVATSVQPDAPPLALDVLRAPGSEWIFAKLYMGAERINHFLISEASALRRFAAAADDWHFVRYADPDQHLRIRFRVDDEANRSACIIELYAWFNTLIQAGTLRRVAIDTYDREVERYGGPGRIALAERLFSADSTTVAALLPELRRASAPNALLAADLAAFAIALTGTAATAKAVIRASLSARRKLPREAWETVRIARPLVDVARYEPIATLSAAIRADLAPPAARDVANAILHMHCNRCGVIGEGELYLRAVSAGICEGLLHDR